MDNNIQRYIPKHIIELVGYKPGKSPRDIAGKSTNLIKLSANEMSLAPDPRVINELKKYTTSHASALSQYPDDWVGDLRSALAIKHRLDDNHFLITNGSNEAILHISRLLLQTGGSAICSKHCFIVFPWAMKQLNRRLKVIDTQPSDSSPLNQNLDKIASAVSKSTRLIYLANPDNPSGAYFSTEKCKAFLKKICPSVIVMIDQAYFEFVTAKDNIDYTSLIKDYPNLIVLRTFSKAHGLAQLRVGYLCGDPQLVGYLKKTKIAFGVNGIGPRLAKVSLGQKKALSERVAVILNNKRKLEEVLTYYGIQFAPSQGNFITFKNSKKCNYSHLLSQGIIARQLNEYQLPQFTRITIGNQKEMNKVFRVIKYLHKHK